MRAGGEHTLTMTQTRQDQKQRRERSTRPRATDSRLIERRGPQRARGRTARSVEQKKRWRKRLHTHEASRAGFICARPLNNRRTALHLGPSASLAGRLSLAVRCPPGCSPLASDPYWGALLDTSRGALTGLRKGGPSGGRSAENNKHLCLLGTPQSHTTLPGAQGLCGTAASGTSPPDLPAGTRVAYTVHIFGLPR
jgi:hypothetical protein